MKYKIELTEEQYHHIALCVEVCHRVSCGDIDDLRQILPIVPNEELFSEIKRQSFPELAQCECYKWDGGYRNDEHGEAFREAFDKFQAKGYQIYREMVHVETIAKGHENVYSSPTLSTDKAEQPKIEVIHEDD